MCGLTGIFIPQGRPVDRKILGAMTDALAHRGPDGSGLYLDGALGLGHRRLAVIDLSSASAQPMISPDARHVLSYNGEVYNFREIRRELEADGAVFRSEGDTEVVLQALIRWGEDALSRFNGMFALAFWDSKRRSLLLARDRYGMKPLYHYHCRRDGEILFGSEIKAFLQHPDFQVNVDSAALVEYITFQNYFSNSTLFSGVELLPAGSFLRIDADGTHRSGRYWDFSFAEPMTAPDENETVEELCRLLDQAVERQMISDVPLGVFLSGGMDTGSIAALASRRRPELPSFTIGFDLRSASGIELNFDERPIAEYMSYLFGTEHYEMVLKAGDMEKAMSQLVWSIEEPRVGQSYPNFYATKLASRFVKVALAGIGGDELFAGYPWRYYRAVRNVSFERYVDTYFGFWRRMVPAETIPRLLSPVATKAAIDRPRDIFRDVFTHHAAELTRPEDYIHHSLYFEAKTFLHGLLVVEDKLSMLRGLEVRQPFLDNDVVDFAMKLPARMMLGRLDEAVSFDENEPGPKTKRFFEKYHDGKLILRRAMSRLLPPSVLEAAKQGFSGPDASWFRGESIDYVRRSLFDGNAMIYDYLDRGTVRALVQDHFDGRENRRLLIWSLLNLEEWLKIFVAGQRPGVQQ